MSRGGRPKHGSYEELAFIFQKIKWKSVAVECLPQKVQFIPWNIWKPEMGFYFFQTPIGCFRFLRMPYGIKTVPDLFNRIYTDAFKGVGKWGLSD